MSPLCRRAVSNLGVLDNQIVFILPDVEVGKKEFIIINLPIKDCALLLGILIFF